MPAFSFLHCADVHLGAPVRGLGPVPDAIRERLRNAPAAAFERIVDVAIDRCVAAVFVAGDLFDGTERNLYAQSQLRDQLVRLHTADIPSFIAGGNHDPLGSFRSSINLPESTHLFGERVERHIVRHDGKVVAHVYGVSYPASAVHRNLAAEFPDAPVGPFNIAVLHANIGHEPGGGPYSPCTVAQLEKSGFDYWALGHVHARETIRAARPTIHYPGNPQALHTKETGARGATLVSVSEAGTVELTPVWTDVARWHRIPTAIDDVESIDELQGSFAEIAGALRELNPNRIHLIRWRLEGYGPLHAELSRPGAIDQLCETLRAQQGQPSEGSPVWLERLELATSPVPDIKHMLEQQDYLGDMLRLGETLRGRAPSGGMGTARSAAAAATATTDSGGAESPETPPRASLVRSVGAELGELLDHARLHRALGEDPWSSLDWDHLISRSQALVVERLAPHELHSTAEPTHHALDLKPATAEAGPGNSAHDERAPLAEVPEQ